MFNEGNGAASLFHNLYSCKDSNIPEISLYKAEKCKTKRKKKDKISEKI